MYKLYIILIVSPVYFNSSPDRMSVRNVAHLKLMIMMSQLLIEHI